MAHRPSALRSLPHGTRREGRAALGASGDAGAFPPSLRGGVADDATQGRPPTPHGPGLPRPCGPRNDGEWWAYRTAISAERASGRSAKSSIRRSASRSAAGTVV
ncbi:MAG: hypothetical protein GC201_14995 [Alphaproteobacteria bacterium]|nr:hypothetical protein [Alphaproteobacteria bacterium]